MSFPIHAKLTHPEFGSSYDKTRAKELISKFGAEYVYTLSSLEVGRYSTKMYFLDTQQPYFAPHLGPYNSVQFDSVEYEIECLV